MPGRKEIVDMDNLFSGAEQIHKLEKAEAEIVRLKEEIEQLRELSSTELETQIETLREELKSQLGVLEIPIAQICPNPSQPRQTFLEESVQSMAHSLLRDGQLQPVILIEQGEQYLLFDGERRWRGAKELGWETLKSVIIPEPQALHRQALLTSLHREDLNPLDKAEAIVLEIANTTQLKSEEIVRILSAVIRRLTKQGKLTELSGVVTASQASQQELLGTLNLSESEQAIISELLALQLNPASIDANIFPMLTLLSDLKTAILKQGLKGSQAMVLQQLSAKNLEVKPKKADTLRQQATTKVIQEKLSVSQTRALVREILRAHKTSSREAGAPTKSVSTVTKGVEKLSLELLATLETSKLEDLQQLLEKKLEDIGAILKQR
jgi:ParB family chromosome partitioning protein